MAVTKQIGIRENDFEISTDEEVLQAIENVLYDQV